MSVQDFLAIHPTVVESSQSDQQTNTTTEPHAEAFKTFLIHLSVLLEAPQQPLDC